jgi:hypothetical protein
LPNARVRALAIAFVSQPPTKAATDKEMDTAMFRISFRKVALTLTTSALALSGLLLATGGAAQAGGPHYRIAPASNSFLYLDVSGGSIYDGAPIIQWSLSGDNQVFTLQPSGGHFELVNRNSGKCVTTDGIAGHQLYQWTCSGTDDQLWDTSLTPNTSVYWIRSVRSGLYVDVAGSSAAQGAAIDTGYWNGGSNPWFSALGA